MASLDSVRQKLFRSQVLFAELNGALREYYETDPVGYRKATDWSPEEPRFMFYEQKPVPALIGLIAGDCLQNIRSSLDYLVWELVLVAGLQPTDRHAFPISQSVGAYNEQLKRERLKGIVPEAIEEVRKLQPMLLIEESARRSHPLALLDLLTNINKHRRILLTGMGAILSQDNSLPPGYKSLNAKSLDPFGRAGLGDFTAFVNVRDSETPTIHGFEIAGVMNTFAVFVINDVLPNFEAFFK